MPEKKTCFVIGPIGEEGSETRIQADYLLAYIIRPVLEDEEFGYIVQRADEIASPGLITDQIIGSIIDSDLVIADLAGHNPNVFYELAIRHMLERPVVHMYLVGEKLPFDVSDFRSVPYRLKTVQDHDAAMEELADKVEAVHQALDKREQFSNPITRARGHQKLKLSSDTGDKLLAELMTRLQKIETSLQNERSNRSQLRRLAEEAAMARGLSGGLGLSSGLLGSALSTDPTYSSGGLLGAAGRAALREAEAEAERLAAKKRDRENKAAPGKEDSKRD